MMEDVGGRFNLALYGSSTAEADIKANISYIADTKALPRAMPREHDVVVLKDIYALHEDKDALLSLSYRTLANAAHIIILEKKGILDTKELMQTLEDFEFRAANTIDVVDGYDLVMAKKMHMWGNGL
ncbi:hypothetical protein FCU45_09750 [Sulfurimonas crateris]|uniref:Uncharacterized protein n=2 Tax=Sulfurimonas crateris TaxID=2574727 RepID=A0A4V5TN50_9BACT|nr:hypothetical protein FCU45_09750 [Sulfurimonas crateris]